LYFRLLAVATLWLLAIAPARAAVTITFWSHELGASFPHAFVSLRGTPDAGGPAVDGNYGFTAQSITPKILMGTVRSEVYIAKPGYVASSDAQFSMVLSDAQYAAILAHITAWSGANGEVRYSLDKRNCIHFVQEAARILGLAGLEQPKLMRKPRSYLKAVLAANRDRVTAIEKDGKDYLASLPPIQGVLPIAAEMLDRDP
jgi:hypothetical protein